MELLEDINKAGTTIIMVTHDADLARRAQRNIQIVDGQVCDFSMYQAGTVQGKADTVVDTASVA